MTKSIDHWSEERKTWVCGDCSRPLATPDDEAIHNTGECNCESSRNLCWRMWGGQCNSAFANKP